MEPTEPKDPEPKGPTQSAEKTTEKESTEKSTEQSTEKKPTESKARLEAVGNLVLPASVACYLFGFLVAMPFYAQAGVPVYAISPQTFIAAGVLFAVVAAAGVVGALGVRKAFLPGVRWWFRLLSLSALSIPYLLLTLLGGSDERPAKAIVLASVFYAAVFYTSVFPRNITWPAEWHVAWNEGVDEWHGALIDGVRLIVFLLGPIGVFALAVYPLIPAQYGGGRPSALIAYARGATSALAQHDEWARLSCRWAPGDSAELSPNGCRTIYKVHESENHLFVAIVEDDAPCPSRAARWHYWGIFTGRPRRICFQRLSNEAVPRLETSGTP